MRVHRGNKWFMKLGAGVSLLLLAVVANAQDAVRSTLLVRLSDASTHAPIGDAVFVIGSEFLPVTQVDVPGRYQLNVMLASGRHRLIIRRIGYRPHLAEFNIVPDTTVDLGELALQPAPVDLNERMVVPTCTRVRKPPKRLRPGTWLTPTPDSAGRGAWFLCDGLFRG